MFSRSVSPLIEDDAATGGVWREATDPDTADVLELANHNDKLRRVVDLTAGRMAHTPWQIMRNEKVVTSPNDPLLVAWNTPNPYMSGLSMRLVLFRYLLLLDECFIRVRLNSHGNLELYPIPNTWVTVLSDEMSDLLFEVHYPTSGTYEVYDSDEMIWIKKPSLEDVYGRAKGRGFAASGDAQTETYAGNFIRSFFLNDATPGMIVSAPGAPSNVAKDLKKTFEEDAKGKAWTTRVITPPVGSKVEVKQFIPALKDLTVPDIEKRCGTNIQHLYHVSPELFGEVENSNRATIKEALAILAIMVLKPDLDFFKQELNARIVPMMERLSSRYRGYSFDFIDPTPPDHSNRDKFMVAKPRNYSLNEWRAASGMPPVQGGDLINAEDGEPFAQVIDELKSVKRIESNRKPGEVVKLRIPQRSAS